MRRHGEWSGATTQIKRIFSTTCSCSAPAPTASPRSAHRGAIFRTHDSVRTRATDWGSQGRASPCVLAHEAQPHQERRAEAPRPRQLRGGSPAPASYRFAAPLAHETREVKDSRNDCLFNYGIRGWKFIATDKLTCESTTLEPLVSRMDRSKRFQKLKPDLRGWLNLSAGPLNAKCRGSARGESPYHCWLRQAAIVGCAKE